MWDYIVLGQVPGTSFQVSFEIWLASVVALMAVTFYLVRAQKHRLLVLGIIALTLYSSQTLKHWRETREAKLGLKVQNT